MPVSIVWVCERAGVFVLILALGFAVGAAFSRAQAVRFVVAAAFLVLFLVPFGNVSGFSLGFSILGPLSVATILGIAIFLGLSLQVMPDAARGELRAVTAVVAVLGFVLYPGALGLLPWDSYQLGFDGATLPVGLICIALAAAGSGFWVIPLWIAVAAVAFQTSLFASLNLWDYLIDPLAWLASIVILVSAASSWRPSIRSFGLAKQSRRIAGTGRT